MNQISVLVAFIVLVVVPLLPAYVLFRALPSSADVSGPLQGLGLKLGGGFAGYFALLVLIFTELQHVRQFVSPETHQVWTVEGNLQDEQGNGVLVGPCEVHFMPEPYGSFASGWFKTTFVTNLGEAGGADFPHLAIAHTGFPPKDIPLNPAELKQQKLEKDMDLTDHTITLNPIILKKDSTPYEPTSALPPPLDSDTYLKTLKNSPSGQITGVDHDKSKNHP